MAGNKSSRDKAYETASEVDKVKLKDNSAMLEIGVEIDKVQLMLARDQLLLLCGKEWSIKQVWDHINELETMKETAFKNSEAGTKE